MNSTNGRFLKTALNLGFATVAPRLAEYLAVDFLMTPVLRSPSRVPHVPSHMTFHRSIVTGMHQLSAWEWGKGPAVLLVHDWNGQASDLEDFVAPLVEAGYRVIAADLPAHGRSSGRKASFADWRRAITALARHAGDVQGVIAEGLGATVALLAAQDGAPLRRLALLAPPQSVRAEVRDRALALGFPSDEVPALMQEFETEQHIKLENLDLRHIANRIAVPSLILEDASNRSAVAPYTVRFLQQGVVPPVGELAHTEFRAAV